MEVPIDFPSLIAAKGLKLVHLNVRSLVKKIDQLRLLLSDPRIEVLTLSETWLRHFHADSSLDIAGYTSFRHDRSPTLSHKSRGGGLITYVSNELATNANHMEKLNTCSPDLEAQLIKIERPCAQNLMICNLYRPPTGDISEAIKYLTKCLNSLNTAKLDIFVMGDWNVNYQNMLSPAYKKVFFFEKSNNLRQVIRDTTRNTDKSKTLLDLIMTNAKHVNCSGTLNSFISDHQPIFVIKKKQRTTPDTMNFTGRSYKNLDLDTLIDNLYKSDWAGLYLHHDPELAWDFLYQKLTMELDKSCPIRKSRVRNYIPDWINPRLREMMKNRDYFYSKAKQTNNDDDWNIAKHLRNVVNTSIRQAKANFVRQQLSDNAKDAAKFWRELKKIYPASKGKYNLHKIHLVDQFTSEPVRDVETADYINKYFINVGNFHPNPNTNQKAQLAIARRQSNAPGANWELTPFTEDEVLLVVKGITTSISSGIAHLKNTILKPVLKVLNSQLTFILNLSVETNSFPNCWKEALVIPIPKSGDSSLVTNLRPISLLPQPGKILEKLVHTKLSHYIETNSLLTGLQYGFRPDRSTLDALYQLTNQINLNLDRKTPTLVTFIDFKKAFDCVQHDLLIHKMKKLNLDPGAILWLESYLNHRKQCVLANSKTSDCLCITQGVPQGSIIGPLLYIIYANEISKIIKHSKIALYADDTVLYSTCKTLTTARYRMQKDLKSLERWCARNGIFINASKTKYMIFASKLKLAAIKDEDIILKVDNQQITRVHSYCYLGITLDEQLNYEQHAQLVIKRVSNKLNQLRSMRYFLNKKASLLIYKNMILPILEYGDIFFSSLSAATLNKLQVIQNRALRLAIDCRRVLNTKDLHKEAKLDKLKVRRKRHILQFLFHKKTNSKLIVRMPRGRVTRSASKVLFKLKKPNSEKFKVSLHYSGLWNALPAVLQKLDDPVCFKHRIKSLKILTT